MRRVVDLPALHARLVDAWGDARRLPDAYAWQWIGYHLSQSDRAGVLRGLLFDFGFLLGKCRNAGVPGLIGDLDQAPKDPALDFLRQVLHLAAPAIAADPTQLAGQLLGRLGNEEDATTPDEDDRGASSVGGEFETLCQQAAAWREVPWLRPLTPSLTQAGGPLLRTLVVPPYRNHSDGSFSMPLTLTELVISDDGRHALSNSIGNRVHYWDLEGDQEPRELSYRRKDSRTSKGNGTEASGDDNLIPRAARNETFP